MSHKRAHVKGSKTKLAILLAATACLSSLPAFSADATVTVDPQKTYQIMDGWGYMHIWEGYRAQAPRVSGMYGCISQCLIPQVPWNILGLVVNFNWWEPTNDNSDPNSFNWAGFQNGQKAPEYFKTIKNSGISTMVMEVGAVPTWWGSDDERVESFAAMLKKTYDEQGVMVTYIAHPNATPALVKKAGQRFAQLGLTTKWIVGNGEGSAGYVTPFLEDTSIARYLAPVVGYRCGEDPNSSSLSALAAIAEQHNKKIWNMKSSLFLGYNSDNDPNGEYYEINQWPYAWMVLNNFYKNLKFGHTSCNLYVDPGHPLLGSWDCNTTRAPCYYVAHQLASTFSIGSQVVDASSTISTIGSLAAKKGTSCSVALVNYNTTSKTVDISGIPNGLYSVVVTDETHKMASIGNQTVSANKLTVTISPKSLTVISTASASTPVLHQSRSDFDREQFQTINSATGQTMGFAGPGLSDISIFTTNGALVTTLHETGLSKVMLMKNQLHEGVYIAKAKIYDHVVTTSFVE